MPRGYRYLILAALGFLVLTAATQGADPKTERQQAAAQQAIANSLQNIAAAENEQTKRAAGSKESEECSPGYDRRYSELCADWKAADAAQFGAYLSITGTILVLVALYFANHANLIARKTAERQLRAYVSGTPEGADFGNANLEVTISITNHGETPAAKCHHIGFVRVGTEAEIREWLGGGTEDSPLTGFGLQPNQVFIDPVQVSGSRAIPDFNEINRDASDGIRIFALGTVWYTDIFDERHRVRYCYWIEMTLPAIEKTAEGKDGDEPITIVYLGKTRFRMASFHNDAT